MPNESGVPTLNDLLSQAESIANSKRQADSKNQLDELLKLLQIQNLDQERQDRATTDLQKQSSAAGLPQSVEALKRVEQAIPGITSGQAKFKSVGGIKNLAPNIAVPVLEKLGIMDPGAANERAALQELSNTKIYDSSGKQINESEMKRIQDAMGLRGIFEEGTINEAGKQIANTAFQKQQNVTAGARPSAVKAFKERGGIGGYKSLQEMLGQPAQQAAQPPVEQAIPASAISPEQRLQELRNKYRK